MNLIKKLLIFNTFIISFKLIICDEYTIINPIRFPYSSVEGPFIGIFVAISVPLDLPNYNLFVSYNFEANYNLPSNETEFSYPPLVSKRSWDRKFIYDILEFKLKSHGYTGKSCLLRIICEASLYSFKNTGVLGDLFHIILTPSTTINYNLSNDYIKAEEHGRIKKHCRKYERKCTFNFLNLISWVGHLFT